MCEAWGYAFHRLKLDLKRKRSVYYWWKFRLTIAIRIDLIEFVTQVHYFCWKFFHSNQLIMFHFSLLIVHLLMHIVRLLNAVTMSLFADALIFALLIACIVWFGLTFVKVPSWNVFHRTCSPFPKRIYVHLLYYHRKWKSLGNYSGRNESISL